MRNGNDTDFEGVALHRAEQYKGVVCYHTFLTRDRGEKLVVPFGRPLCTSIASKRIGGITYLINAEENLLETSRFFPFGSHPERTPLRVLLGKGVADRIQLLIAHELAQRFPEYSVTSTAPSPERETQLERLGIVPERTYRIEEYCTIIADAIRREQGRQPF